MSLRPSLTQVQTLKVHLTPQLRQSIQLLQLSATELSEYLQEQAVENPVLDIEWIPPSRSRTAGSDTARQDHALNNIGGQAPTLEQMLLGELRLIGLPEPTHRIACYLAGNLNENGYVTISPEEAGEVFGVSAAEVLEALYRLQDAAPAGIGARNLQECLLLQIRRDPGAHPWAEPLVSRHLADLGAGRHKTIADKLGIPLDDVMQALAYIRSLHPRPGLLYGSTQAAYVEPDAYIECVRGQLVIRMSEAHLPRLSLNTSYRQMLADSICKDTKSYLRQHEQAAQWLIRSVEQRKRTLCRVIECIVSEQAAFFTEGIDRLKPMNLKAVAEKLELHESTVSRAVQHKVVQTPQGFFELSYFFSARLQTEEGDAASAASVKAKIKLLIEHEDKRNPLSDQKITDLLVQEGIRISRRTVMKYREEMHLLSSRLRTQA
ncbi:RNA polymerase factor sigma-54 [Paenibacillus elgii]|uniref:RNA polymerase factor sigma-54 n=1 Tax=Paenibacillus elgii TaxID=189691 RepID=UPI0013D59669|nr:RNA polymerase factor sigma-54 [Paenibacillus elgii]